MKKSILISIKPKWCAKIMNRDKTIEELCDRFVVVEHGLDDPFNVDFETAKTFIGKAKIYGAI